MTMLLPFDTAGAGPVVLLLHAGIADRRMWRSQLPALAAAGYQGLAPDLRGFGDGPAASEPYSHVGDLLSLLDAQGVTRFSLVGVSMGGEVALELALAAPARVEKLMLVSTLAGLTMADEPSLALQQAWAEADEALERGDLARATEIDLIAWVVGQGRVEADLDGDYLDLGRRMIARTWEWAASGKNTASPIEPETPGATRLAEVHQPALLVAGDHELPDVVASMDRLSAGIQQATRAEIANCAHLPPLERPAEFNRLLLTFLGG